MSVLLSTPHGSHLYGMAHPGSDRDTYVVVERKPFVAHNGSRARYAKQKMSGREDEFTIDLSTWLLYCDKGVPQALEAMFSPCPTVDRLAEFRAQYRAGTQAFETYRRTIVSFAHAGDFKRRRHAMRLGLNMRDLRLQGWFNPMLSEPEVELVNDMATKYNKPRQAAGVALLLAGFTS